jgi:hypothetical protein
MGQRHSSDLQAFNTELDGFLACSGTALGIQSPMDTGKTTLCNALVQELEDTHGERRVCFITYRQSLALNMLSSKLQDLGCVCYMDADVDLPAQDRVIVQLDSICRVCCKGCIIPKYDLLVLDEISSLLQHCTGKTMVGKQARVFRTFCAIIRSAKRVLVMDAFLGKETRAFFKALKVPLRVVRNTYRPLKPRTFVFTNDEASWVHKIVKALGAGKNVALASMSANALHKLKAYLLEEGILSEDQMLLIDSKSDDSVKAKLQDVNGYWVLFRLVMWSPAVEAGVDFSVNHFHHLFMYICKSTTPNGLTQMSGRVRKLPPTKVSLTIHCMCARVTTNARVQPYTAQDALDHFQWQKGLTWDSQQFVCDFLQWQEIELESGHVAMMLTLDDPATCVAAYNYARLQNASTRFLPEFIDLLEHAGHMWRFGKWVKGRKARKPVLPTDGFDPKTSLLDAQPVQGKQADVYQLHVILGTATREMKDSLDRHWFCRAWGIRAEALDGDFLRYCGISQVARPLEILRTMLAAPDKHAPPPHLCEDPVELSFEPVIAPAMILNELLRSLSIDNLLDPTQNRCTLTADTLEALSHCTCFKRDTETMQKVERVFGMDAKGAAVFKEPGDIANRIKTLFRRAGIHCETSSKRRQVNGVKQKAVYTVDFRRLLETYV